MVTYAPQVAFERAPSSWTIFLMTACLGSHTPRQRAGDAASPVGSTHLGLQGATNAIGPLSGSSWQRR